DKSIDDILDLAAKKRMRLVWIGPPCVHRPWDTRARELDKMLAAKLPPRGVTYVPMRDASFCSGGMHEPDGVHLKTKGYVYMWASGRRAAGPARPGALRVAAAGPPDLPASRTAPPPESRFELAAAPAPPEGAVAVDEPKVYVLRVKRGGSGTRTN